MNKLMPYKPHLFYKLYRALQDEGIDEKDMAFDYLPTFVSDIGFFTFDLRQEYPQVRHLVVFGDKRTWANSLKLCFAMIRFLIAIGFVRFIAFIPKDKKFFLTTIRYISKERNLHPYATDGIGDYYLIRIAR